MFKPLSVYIGLRYTRAKRRNHFISFISLTSMLGIALGITVLITVLSVMNGFDYQIKRRIFSMANQVTITTLNQGITNWQALSRKVAATTDVTGVAPFVNGQGMLSNKGVVRAVIINGIAPKSKQNVFELGDKIVAGSLTALKPGNFGIVMGDKLAQYLGLQIGAKVTLFTPQINVSPAAVMPRFKRFTLVGIFHAGTGFEFNTRLAYINIHDAQALYQLGSRITGLRLKLDDLYKAPQVVTRLAAKLTDNFWITDWTQQFGSFFKAIAMEKTMMFLILLLIIAVAVFNLVSTLVMVVTDKQADIAILRTLGASPRFITTVFIIQGLLVGLFGTLLGLIGGVLLATHVTKIFDLIQTYFHIQFLSSSVYYVNYLPSRLQWPDVWHICIAALVMSLVATIYPAWRASRVQPAEALRYE